MAMARLSSATGEPVRRVSSPYSAAVCAQSHGISACSGGGGGLQDIRPAAAQGGRAAEPGAPSRELLSVPAWPGLIAEQHELAVAKPRLAAGVVQEHHRRQPVNLGLVRQYFGQATSQPDCLSRELVAAAVALVEDQVNDGENGVETLAEQVNRWHPKRDRR